MASWPGTLPAPLFSSYALTPVDQTVRSDMEVGLARVRRRTAARADRIAVQWAFTDAQIAIFRAWFDDASTGIAGGSAWFTATLAIGTGGAVSCTARFAGAPQAQAGERYNWIVSATLEVR